jgi:hypothetical protein
VGSPFITRDTVLIATPASAATSFIVGLAGRPRCSAALDIDVSPVC